MDEDDKKLFDSFFRLNKINDCEYFNYLYKSINIIIDTSKYVKFLIADIKLFGEFYYIVIIYLDTLIIRDIFFRYFIKDKNLEIIYVPSNNNCHPDSTLAFYISFNLNNDYEFKSKYVGLSHFCCLFCSLFLESYGLDFRGISNKFDSKWILPLEVKINSDEHTMFMKMVNQLNYQISPIESKLPTQRLFDLCQQASGFISDDICHYLAYYKVNLDISHHFIIDDLNKHNKFLLFISKLREAFHCNNCNTNN